MEIQAIYCAVGIDVHLATLMVCIIVRREGSEPEIHQRQFGGFKHDRRAMAEWIAGFHPDTTRKNRGQTGMALPRGGSNKDNKLTLKGFL